MEIIKATTDHINALAMLIWLDTHSDPPGQAALDSFTTELSQWWAAHHHSHHAFAARSSDEIIGMAWLAIVPHVPRPGATRRRSADIQSVYVLPKHRSRGTGSALVEAASTHAFEQGAVRVTVHSGRRAVPVYERLGFAPSYRLLQRPPDAHA